MQRDAQLSAQLGVQHGTVQMPVGGILKYEQRAMLALSPIFFAHHVALALSQAARGFQEAVIPSEVFVGIVVVQFQRLVGVLFSSRQLLDTGQIEFPKGKGVLGHVSNEPGRFSQSHHHQVGHAVLGGIVDLVVPVRGQDVVGAQFASHRGITDHVPVHVQKELSGDGGIQRHLTEQHFHFDVLGSQSQLVGPRVPHGEEIGRVQVHLDADLHLGHQQLAEMKHLDEGFEAQDVGGSIHVLDVLGFHLAHIVLDVQGQGGKIGVGDVHLVGRQGRGGIDPIEPPLGSQNRLSVVSVVVQDGFQVGFVSVHVGLGTDQGVVETDADLFEEGMRQVVDQRDGIRGRQVASPRFLEGQFHLEEAAGQIDKVRLGIDLKFHGVDARREGADGDVASAPDAQIGEQIQHGIYHPLGARRRRRC